VIRAGLTIALLAAALVSPVSMTAGDDRIPASGGEIAIRPLAHASVQLEHAGLVIQVDPWSRADLNTARPADLILITDADAGAHHLDPAAIQKLRKSAAPVLIPAAGKATVADGTAIANGEHRELLGVRIEAIAAYDLIPGEPFHSKGNANGYVVTVGGKRIYFAGVTECVPEMRALRNIDVAFLPMNLPHGRMTPAAVAECLRAFKPKVTYPYHFDQGYIARLSGRGAAPAPGTLPAADTVRQLAEMLKGEQIEVRLGDWYPMPVSQ
jgi:L-ascorbate metabolism protein UlaG (beta-lactamase superfamily)